MADARAMPLADERARLGRAAEDLIAKRLTAAGFSVVGRNVRVGRLELDLIAQRAGLIVFCEVRARAHDRFVAPAATMDPRKVARVKAAAAQWLRAERPARLDVRFDVAAVVFDVPGGRIDYYEGAY
ncbi:MAG TPA: YraN family protein [Polyangiales bacterium]|nr:YraN family protein [Polyangiales bacterium]